MKINALLESTQLDENLGNLAALNLGKLSGLLKQTHGGVGKKFANLANLNFANDRYSGPGNTSEIVDIGVLKKGIVGLRKAYRDYTAPEGAQRGRVSPHPVGFAVYLNNRAVAFGLFTADSLAGRTRSGQFAYDLSGFEAQIDAAHERENASRPQYNKIQKMNPNSAYDKTEKEFHNGWRNDPVEVTKKFVGTSISTEDLSTFLTRLDQIANDVGGTITLKLVTNDYSGIDRRQTRTNAASGAVGMGEIRDAGKALRDRLLRYKNSKRPTADTIHRFLEMVMKEEASVVNFGGRPWRTAPGNGYSSDAISPIDLMKGKPFVMQYTSAEGSNKYTSDSIKISYRYDPMDNTIKPWQAQYTDEKGETKTIPMDVGYWVKDKLRIRDLEKPTVIKAMLTKIKESQYETNLAGIETVIKAMRGEGINWPEFDIIEKSIATERAKPKT